MSLVDEISVLTEGPDNTLSYAEAIKLSEKYQEMLNNGLVKPRGFTLQTIDEKQKDFLIIGPLRDLNLVQFKITNA